MTKALAAAVEALTESFEAVETKAPVAKKVKKPSVIEFTMKTDSFGNELLVVPSKDKYGAELIQALNDFHHYYSIRQMKGAYDFCWLCDQVEEIVDYFKHHDVNLKPFATLFKTIEDRKTELKAAVDKRIADGSVQFSDLTHVYVKGTEIIVGSGDTACGGIVSSITLQKSMFGPYYIVKYTSLSNTTGKTKKVENSTTFGYFKGKQKLDGGDVRRITPKEKDALKQRGMIFRDFAAAPSYVSYTGSLSQPSWGGTRLFRADGRVMIDANALAIADPELYRSCQYGAAADEDDCEDDGDNETDSNASKTINDSDLWLCAPTLIGFSFTCKRWGFVQVASLTNIRWRTDAFDKLVLAEEDKTIVRALVEHNEGSFTDIIDGKGGGTIFLLHGLPGLGKTALAETTAETLKRPLYTVSVGELGVNPDELEARLRQILDLAIAWNAVLLLDEADIFLEARNEDDIVRNAMVGVFLRLLEYQSTTIFLTTNRVKNIDQAFFSRISVALQFDAADEDKLSSIWCNLLQAANIEGIDNRLLAQRYGDLNGRQIKNAIRLAQTLARSQDVEIGMDHIERTIKLGTRFQKDFIGAAR